MDLFKRSKKDKGKSTAVSPPQEPPSTPASSMKPTGSKLDKKAILEKGQGTLEAASKVLDILEDLGQSSSFLAPMKVVCGLLNDAVKRAILVEQNDEELQGLSEELLQQLKHVKKYAEDLSDPKFSKFMDEAKEPLDIYTKDLNELIDALTITETRYEPGLKNYTKRFMKASEDRDHIQSCRDKLKKSFEQFGHALVEFIAHQTMIIRAKVEEVHTGVEDVKVEVGQVHSGVKDVKVEVEEVHIDVKEVNTEVKGVRAAVEEMDAKADAGRVDDAINQLPYAIPSKHHGTCLAGTRQKIIEEIANWAADPNAVPVLALIDQAGTGKSTLATHMMEKWDKRDADGSLDRDGGGLLMGRFYFCKPGTVTGEKVASTIATDVANRIPSLRSVIQQALQKVKPIAACSIQKQLEEVVFAPLRSLDKPYIIVIDALDECSEEDRAVFLEATSKFFASYPSGGAPLKIFLTCRPENDIVSWMQKQMGAGLARRVDFSLHVEGNRSNEDDIRLYTIKRLPMLTSEQTDQFVNRAGQLFIWASTAVEFLSKAKNFKGRFQTLMSSTSKKSPLDDLYSEILNAALSGYEEEEEMDLRKVLQAICAAKEPLHIATMNELLRLDAGVVDAIVMSLGSVLSDGAQDQPVHVLHPTFLEHLQNPSKPGPIFISNNEAECLLAGGCLSILSNGLKYDICGVLQPKTKPRINKEIKVLWWRLGERTTQGLRYAAIHTLSHVALCLGDKEIVKELQVFFENKLLNWVELMSFLGKVYSAIQALHNLKLRIEDIFKSLSNTMLLDVQEWCDETLKLIQPYQAIIEASAMQVYFSALPFFPPTTRISRRFLPSLQQFIPKVVYQRTPSSASKVLAGHQSNVTSISISSDDQYVTSADSYGIIKRWEVVTGGCVEELSVSSSYVVIQPSTNGIIAAVIDAGNIALRNVRTGKVLWEVQYTVNNKWDDDDDDEDDEDAVDDDDQARVVFSADGRFLASYYNLVMQISDVETGKANWRKQFESRIRDIALSPDGILLANVDDEWVVRLWDIATGKSIVLSTALDPQSNSNPFDNSPLSFSSDGTILAGLLPDTTIRLWYLKDGEVVRHQDIIGSNYGTSLAFSPLSHILAYAVGSTIHIYGAASGKAVGEPLRGHAYNITCLAFLSNGHTLASGSKDKTVRLWELTVTEAVDQPHLEQVEPNGKVACLALSFDGCHIACGYNGGEVCLWDTEAGKVKWRFNGDGSYILSLAFSSDDHALALGDYNGGVKIWDVASGKAVGNIVGRGDAVISLAFSSDSRLVAAGSDEGNLMVWDVPSGEMVAERAKGDNGISWSIIFRLHQGNNFLIMDNKRIWDISADRLYDSNDENVPFKLVHLHSESATARKPYISIGESFTFVLPPRVKFDKYGYMKGRFACGGENGMELIVDCSHLI